MADFIDKMIDNLHRMQFDCRVLQRNQVDITRVELLTDPPLEQQALYITTELPETLPAGSNVLFLTDKAIHLPDIAENQNVILTNCPLSPEQLQSLLRIWLESYRKQQDDATRLKLVQCVALQNSLKRIVELASTWLGNPVAIMDMAHNAVEKIQPATYPENLDSLFGALHPSEGMLRSIISSGYQILNKLLAHEAAIMTPKDLPRNYISLIFVKDVAIAGVSVMELNRPFVDADCDKVQFLSMLLSLELRKSKYSMINSIQRKRAFFYDILRNNALSESDLNKRLQYFHFPLNHINYLLTVDSRLLTAEEQESLVNKLSILRGDLAILFDGYAVVLLSLGTPGTLDLPEILKQYAGLISMYDMKAGLSTGFQSLMNVKLYFQQAVNAIIWNNRLGTDHVISRYDDYAVNHIISQCESAYDLMHPAIKSLALYDMKKDTCLTATLYCYLKNDRSTVRTAQAMHVHRNTINFRINKIKELIPFDWDDTALIRYLLLSLVILEGKDVTLLQRR